MAASAPRHHLTLQQKMQIIEKHERDKARQKELAEWATAEFHLDRVPTQPTISNILRNKDKLIATLRHNPSRTSGKSVREVTCPAFEDAVVSWIKQQEPGLLSRRAILEQAASVHDAFPRAKDLMLSVGWLSRLLERHGINLRVMNGSVESDTDDGEVSSAYAPSPTSSTASMPSIARSTSDLAVEGQPQTHQVTRSLICAGSSLSDEPRPQHHHHHPPPPPPPPPSTPPIHHPTEIHEYIADYYGRRLRRSTDLKTILPESSTPSHPFIQELLHHIPVPVMDHYFGCGMSLPVGIDGLHVLDLGCGAGRDTYILSVFAGVDGSVTGIDMTHEVLEIAKANVIPFSQSVARSRSSLNFLPGHIEQLDAIGFQPATMDLITANMVLSLSPTKQKVLAEAFRVLRSGGELYISDIFASRRLPDNVRGIPELFCEGLGGAFYLDDFEVVCRLVGFGQPRQVSITPITLRDESLVRLAGPTQYYSITYRCFKVPDMELRPTEEDYGHVVRYLGTIPGFPVVYHLDACSKFELRRPVRVGGNTAAILKHSWLARHFHVDGDWSEHFGPFIQAARGVV